MKFVRPAMASIIALNLAAAPAQAQFQTDQFVNGMVRLGIGLAIDAAQDNNSGPRQQGSGAPVRTSEAAQPDEQLRQVQAALTALGYDPGPVDGLWGRKTQNAIMRFQGDQGYSPDGVLTDAQAEVLLAGNAQPATGRPEAAPSVTQASAPALSMLPVRNGAILLAPFAPANGMFYESDGGTLDRLSGGYSGAYRRAVANLALLLILRDNPGYLKAPNTTGFFLPLIEPDRLKPYVRARHLETLGRFPSSDEMTWAGNNQFERQDNRNAWIAGFYDEIVAQRPTLPLRVDIVRPIRIGDYAPGSLSIEVSETPIFPSASTLGMSFTLDDGADAFPESWIVSEQDARQIVGAVTAKWDSPNDAYGDDMPVAVTQLEITSVTNGKATTRLVSAEAIVYLDETMTTELGRIPLNLPKEPEATKAADLPTPVNKPAPVAPAPQPKPDPAVEATLRGSADAPQSRFDLLGLHLGMGLAEAKVALGKAYDGAAMAELNASAAFPADAPVCHQDLWRREQDELARVQSAFELAIDNKRNSAEGLDDNALVQIEAERLESAAQVRQQIRQQHFDTGCAVPPMPAMAFAYGVEVNRGQGLVERAIIYATQGEKPVVAAVFRQVEGDQYQGMVSEAARTKYGAPDYEGSSLTAWMEHPAMAERMSEDPACRQTGFGPGNIPGAWMERNCGAFVVLHGGNALMIDTRYNALASEAVGKEAEANAPQKPTIAF